MTQITASAPAARLTIVQRPSLAAPTARPLQTSPVIPASPSDTWQAAAKGGGIPATEAQIQQDFGAQVQIRPKAQSDGPYYGEDFAAMFLKGRTPQDIQAYLQSSFVTSMAEMMVLDRYKPALEAQLQDWMPFLKRSDVGGASTGKVLDVNLAFQFHPHADRQENEPAQTWTWVKPTVGVKVTAPELNGVMIKPGMDVVTYQDQNHNTAILAAGVAVNVQGKVYPDAEVVLTHGLVNPKTPSHPNTYAESRTHFDTFNNQLTVRLGARREIGTAHAVGVYGRYTHAFVTESSTDVGVGAYYQKKW